MGQKAAADHQHALVAKWAKTPADLEELLGIEAWHRDLQHRDIGIRIHHRERYVGAMVKPALGLLGNQLIGKEPTHVGGEFRRAGRGIARSVVPLREATEVI